LNVSIYPAYKKGLRGPLTRRRYKTFKYFNA
jgi:hypothetical protein